MRCDFALERHSAASVAFANGWTSIMPPIPRRGTARGDSHGHARRAASSLHVGRTARSAGVARRLLARLRRELRGQ
jgi:hypothetical protein